MDGTSGALYAIFTNSLAAFFKARMTDKVAVDAQFWASALKNASMTLAKYTSARPGDRTLVDALEPFVQTFSKTADVYQASSAAEDGAVKTADMKASLGRSVYVGNEAKWEGKVPDPGAWGLSKFLSGLSSALQ